MGQIMAETQINGSTRRRRHPVSGGSQLARLHRQLSECQRILKLVAFKILPVSYVVSVYLGIIPFHLEHVLMGLGLAVYVKVSEVCKI